MLQIEILWKKANLLSESISLETSIPSSTEETTTENKENVFLPSTIISLPILARATHINEQSPVELNEYVVKSEIFENSANPEYNFSTKFKYNHIQQLINDLLLSNSSNCNILLQNSEPAKKSKKNAATQDTMFGAITMKWKEWILSAINDDKKCENWIFSLPILDPENNTLKKGEIDLEIIFYSPLQQENVNDDEKEQISWQKCNNFMELIPDKYSYLNINANNIKSIPNTWFSKSDDNKQNLISISFEVMCCDNYSEKIEINLPIQMNENENETNDQILCNKEWIVFIDEFGLNYYLNKAQNKESFDIEFEHMISEKGKKEEIINTSKHRCCLSLNLRPFKWAGTYKLSDTEYTINWLTKEENEESKQSIQSNVEIAFSFKHPLVVPCVKPIPSPVDLCKKSEIRNNYEQQKKKNTKHIDSKTQFQAIIAIIQEELKNKYLKVCTTYNDMTKEVRKETFRNYLLSSTNGQRLTNIISKVIVSVAKDEMYQESELKTEELTMKLRAKLESACDPVFASVINKMNSKSIRNCSQNDDISNTENLMKPYLQCTNIDNIFAEPLRNMNTIKTLIEIAFLNQDYQAAQKWITQAMAICQDKKLYCKLYMDLAFVLSQTNCDTSMSYHCITHCLSMNESKEILYTKIMMLCEQDKLEEGECFMNRLMELFPNDPHVNILKGIFEYVMEEVEDAENIWKNQIEIMEKNNTQLIEEKNEIENKEEEKAEQLEYELKSIVEQEKEKEENVKKYNLYDLWIFALDIALRYDCKRMTETILNVSKPFFQNNEKHKIDFILLQHQVLIYDKKYEMALSTLGEAILMNDHDTRLWLHIGSTYYFLNKFNDSIEALQRHIDECSNQQLLPNLMGMFSLIEICLIAYKHNTNDISDNLLKNALSLLQQCWQRIENNEICNDDTLNILVSFTNRDIHFINAVKYKLWTIQGQYFFAINDTTSALSNYAHASNIHPFDDKLWKQVDNLYKQFGANNIAKR